MKFAATGLAIILGTNAIVLAGVTYNRAGEPEATLRLTERELSLYDYGMWADEKSGISLRLQWRLPQRDATRSGKYFGSWGGEAAWLDERKLRELGYDPPPPGISEDRRGRREQERAVYVALEMEGPAYQAVLGLAQDAAAKERAGGSTAKNSYDSAVSWLEREERSASRLFAVDAGLDAAALRARYPDRKRYAIVEGRVRPYYRMDARGLTITGHLAAISVSDISVPFEHRSLFTSLPEVPYRRHSENPPRYAAQIEYGKRLEPYLSKVELLSRPN